MQVIFDSQNKSIVRIDRGEDCLDVLKSLAQKKDLSFNFSMIGGCSLVELGYYDLKTKKYFTQEFKEEGMEILSASGNVAWSEGAPIVHAHGVFSKKNYECFGGHISRLVISLTGEAVINWLPEKIIKKLDDDTGLKLLTV